MNDTPQTKIVDVGDGRRQLYIYRTGVDPSNGQSISWWEPSGTPYYPREQGPSQSEQASAANAQLARDKFAYEQQQDEIARQQKVIDAAIRDAEAAAERMEKARQFDEAKAEREKERQYRADRDRLDDQQRALDNEYRNKQLAISEGNLDVNRGQLDLQRDKYEDDLANSPGNYFNYSFRSRGMEPPGSTSELSGAKEERPWWMNYSLERLERFPDEELATLPPEVLAKFRNEFLLKRPALLAMLSPERIRGEGQYQGTGFASEVISSLGRGAPAPPMPKAQAVQPPQNTPAAPGAPLPIGGTGKPLFNTPTGAPPVQPPQPGVGSNGVIASNNLFPAPQAQQAPPSNGVVQSQILMPGQSMQPPAAPVSMDGYTPEMAAPNPSIEEQARAAMERLRAKGAA